MPVRLIAGVHACRSRVHKLSASSCEVYAVRTFGSRTSSVHCCRLCTRDERPARLAHEHDGSGAALSGRHSCTGRLRSAAAAAGKMASSVQNGFERAGVRRLRLASPP